MYQHLHEPPPLLPPMIPLGVRLQVERLLVKAPQGRPADALSVQRALETALAEEAEGGTKSTVVLKAEQGAAQAEAEGGTGVGHPPVEAGQETIAPKTVIQPATVVQPRSRAVSTRSRTRSRALRRYGAAGGVLVLALVIGGQWYRSRQPAEEAWQPPEAARQASQAEPGSKGEKEREQQEEVAKPPLRDQQPQQEAKGEPPERAAEVRQQAEERKKAETAQQVAELLEKAQKQRVAKRLTTPAGDNALETYKEVLRVMPGHEEALAGVKEIKEQYRPAISLARRWPPPKESHRAQEEGRQLLLKN